MLTCSRCSFQHPFEWAMNEHIYVKHGIVTDMTPRGEIPRPPTKLRVGPDGGCAPTKKFADKNDMEQEIHSEMEIRKIRERWYMDY